MDYKTQRKKMIMPEYGRLVQEMVDYALTIKDRAERQCCANTIVGVMANLYPQQRDIPDFMHKLWDQLAVMSNYKLDIDYPYEITPKKDGVRPPRVAYPMQSIRYRHYGHLLESLLNKIKDMPEGEERNVLVKLTAGQMKRSLAAWNKDILDGEKIADDLARYTDGKIQMTPDALNSLNVSSVPQGGIFFKAGQRSKRNRKN